MALKHRYWRELGGELCSEIALFQTLTYRYMKTILKTACLSALLGGLVLIVASPVRSQDFDLGTPAIDLGQAVLSTIPLNAALDGITGSDKIPRGARSTSTAAATQKSTLSYSPTPSLKRNIVQGYIDRLRTKNPTASRTIAENFGSGRYDYGQIYQGLVKGKGLRENDAADAMSAYLILGYMIVNNVQDGNVITASMARGVRSQVAPLLVSNSRLTASGIPAQLGEEMKLQTVIVQGGWQSAIKENSLSNYQQGIATLFKNRYGLDLTQVTLTDRGFAKK